MTFCNAKCLEIHAVRKYWKLAVLFTYITFIMAKNSISNTYNLGFHFLNKKKKKLRDFSKFIFTWHEQTLSIVDVYVYSTYCILTIFFVLYARNVCLNVILRILWKDLFLSCLSDLKIYNFIKSHKFTILLKSMVLTVFQIANLFILQAIETQGNEQEELWIECIQINNGKIIKK